MHDHKENNFYDTSQQGRGNNEPPPPLQNPIVQFERLCVCDGNSWTHDDMEWKKTFFKYGLYVSLWYDSSLPRVISCVYAKFGWNPLSGTWEGGGGICTRELLVDKFN